ncbi:biotin--[acetyl-CoA-carboxylase] ligase [Iodidimonas gelatinilytica]|uniref:biotin--[biotin carboxyl-carrier protein] ligase n=1 Tax=Iodidimonas gelatinilytica TaxID=1236966 RepID=A0A5A7N139_9PROT|nr:biotin--[acetyl-CoA-carboxylase] ligase [Iodidimonas gelatinilytica]GER01425.1 biotin--[acetyl-CoA-carboxylase] ligase [Iodidimonas gelatinilytica]
MIRLPSGERCQHFVSLDSTNEEARRRARSGEAGPLWIVADHQAQGRGRRGRVWQSKAGNLFVTCLLTPNRPGTERAQLSFVAALALHDALSYFEEGLAARLRCKWPNDLLLDGVKLAGILLESEGDWVAIGLGVNLAEAPENVERPATSLCAALGRKIDPMACLDVLSLRLQARRAQWEEFGFEPIRNDWLMRAYGLGGAIDVRLDNRSLMGRFAGLDRDGALLLDLPDQTQKRITAGDVFPLTKGA